VDGTATDVSATDPLPVVLTSTTITGTVAATQSGTWNITNISGTVSLPTGAATAAKQPALGTAGTASADVITVQGITSMTALKVDGSAVTQPVSLAASATAIAKAEDVASADADVGVPAMAVRKAAPANTSGTDGDYEMLQMSAGRLWVDASGVTLTVGSHAVTNAGTFAVQATVAAGATTIGKAEDVASTDADVGVPAMVVRKATPANSSGTDGDYEFMQASGGYLWVHDNKGLSNLAFVAAFTTLTRPANTTAYTASDSISDNATAGSVTALSATISDTNDDPIFISDILINSTDTGLAGKKLRANLFNADPTASTGVSGGDNAAYSQKKNGYIGTFVGTLESGFSDGTVGRLVPSFRDTNYTPAGGFVVCKPTSGARTLYIQYVAEEAFTPSANSTTIIGTARGWQARAV
jgi:hypothetical protein